MDENKYDIHTLRRCYSETQFSYAYQKHQGKEKMATPRFEVFRVT